MVNFNGALIVGTLCAVLAGTAYAGDDTFETTFTYNKSVPMVENYSNFERTAKSVCQTEVSSVGQLALSARSRLELHCRNELLTKVVKATKNEILIAHHQRKMSVRQG